MGKLNDIRQKLLAGSTTKQLIDQGYAKSSVFSEAKKLTKWRGHYRSDRKDLGEDDSP